MRVMKHVLAEALFILHKSTRNTKTRNFLLEYKHILYKQHHTLVN